MPHNSLENSNSSFTVAQSTPSSNVHSTGISTEITSSTQMKPSTSSFEAPSDQSTSELMDTTYQSKSTTRTTIKTSDKSTTKVTSASVVSTELQSTAKTGCIIVPHPQKQQINPNRA